MKKIKKELTDAENNEDSYLKDFERFCAGELYEPEHSEGWGFPGPIVNGKLKSKIRKVGNKSPIKNVDELIDGNIYEVISSDGMNLRVSCPNCFKYSKEHYKSIPIKLFVKKGEKIMLLANPVKCSPTDYWCLFATELHPLMMGDHM